MMQHFKISIALGGLAILAAGCADNAGSFPTLGQGYKESTEVVSDVAPETQESVAETEVASVDPDVLTTGVTPQQAATVSEAEVAAATAAPSTSGALLGETVGSLGLLERTGIWVRTPLVTAETEGRIVVKSTGKSANVTLIPLGGDAGAGSQISLAAMQLLGIPLTDLPVLDVYKS
ncbi:hypothetical protein BFP76_03560 [Amylibacter kogurei]|uniref:D-galactarate dehydratase n=2 Tax=Paramylibacter kogurei TaxID=1889778 RepID=A0A2G5K443_9RHOB|nr:hypothetical protein BFP76_03560 [Amylibacter kogurei]